MHTLASLRAAEGDDEQGGKRGRNAFWNGNSTQFGGGEAGEGEEGDEARR